MFEDSITSSPNKINRSIHKARLQRKIRRRCGAEFEENEVGAKDENKAELVTSRLAAQERVISLADMYWEDDECGPNNSNMNRTFRVQPKKYGADFDPFEDELLLAVADRLDSAQAQLNNQKMQQLKSKQGFHKCSQLLLESDEKEWEEEFEFKAKPDSPTGTHLPPITNGPKTQFGITESELMHFCAAVEEEGRVEKETFEETPPPKKHKTIVESILDDFCSSPLSLDGQELCSHLNNSKTSTVNLEADMENATPAFNSKNKPLRTYSCRRRRTGVRTSIAQRLENVALVDAYEDDNLSNCSSGLSVQEDLTQPAESLLGSVELNKSIKVCENLQNLSAYFSQQSILNASPTSQTKEIFPTAKENSQGEEEAFKTLEAYFATTAHLIEQIIALRKEHVCFFSEADYSDEFDFRGFSLAIKEIDETLLNRDDQKLSPTSFRWRNVLDGDTLLYKDDCAAGMFENEICSISSITDITSTEHNINCASTLQKSSNRAEELFSDSEDEWHDECDFFKHFKTQDALRRDSVFNDSTMHPATPPKKFYGFISASRKPILVSEAAQQRAARILAEIDDNLFREASQKYTTCKTNQVPSEESKPKDLFFEEDYILPGFQTASKKQIKISEEAKKRAYAFLSDLSAVPVSKKENLDCFESFKPDTKNEKCNGVNIEDVELGDIQLSEWLIDDASKNIDPLKTVSSAFKGFETASKKNITISAAAKKQALKILNDLPELPKSATDEGCEIPKNFETAKSSKDLTKSATDGCYSACTGFRTASRKSINISVEAKKRAAKILETLPEISKKNVKNTPNAAESLEKIQLSEWQINSTSNNEIDDQAIITTTKRKLEQITEDLDKYIQTPEQTSNTRTDITKMNLHRTPFTPHIDNDSLGASDSSTPLTKNPCLTSFAKSAIISRKNLLSLSKRKKIKNNQDIRTFEETTATPTAGHIVRMSTTSVTPNVKEFFDALPNTSTPRPIRIRSEVPVNPNEIDMDFKHIEWENDNALSTLNYTKTPSSSKFNTSCENITVISANPSPKMRIARLHIYGKPPPVSPILMSSTNNCRPSGLRRGRSMQKHHKD